MLHQEVLQLLVSSFRDSWFSPHEKRILLIPFWQQRCWKCNRCGRNTVETFGACLPISDWILVSSTHKTLNKKLISSHFMKPDERKYKWIKIQTEQSNHHACYYQHQHHDKWPLQLPKRFIYLYQHYNKHLSNAVYVYYCHYHHCKILSCN